MSLKLAFLIKICAWRFKSEFVVHDQETIDENEHMSEERPVAAGKKKRKKKNKKLLILKKPSAAKKLAKEHLLSLPSCQGVAKMKSAIA